MLSLLYFQYIFHPDGLRMSEITYKNTTFSGNKKAARKLYEQMLCPAL